MKSFSTKLYVVASTADSKNQTYMDLGNKEVEIDKENKVCSTCKKIQPLSEFHKRKEKYRAKCKSCVRIYLEANKEQRRITDKLRRAKNKKLIKSSL